MCVPPVLLAGGLAGQLAGRNKSSGESSNVTNNYSAPEPQEELNLQPTGKESVKPDTNSVKPGKKFSLTDKAY